MYKWTEANYPPTIFTCEGVGSVTCGLHSTGWKYLASGKWYDSLDDAKAALIKAYEEKL